MLRLNFPFRQKSRVDTDGNAGSKFGTAARWLLTPPIVLASLFGIWRITANEYVTRSYWASLSNEVTADQLDVVVLPPPDSTNEEGDSQRLVAQFVNEVRNLTGQWPRFKVHSAKYFRPPDQVFEHLQNVDLVVAPTISGSPNHAAVNWHLHLSSELKNRKARAESTVLSALGIPHDLSLPATSSDFPSMIRGKAESLTDALAVSFGIWLIETQADPMGYQYLLRFKSQAVEPRLRASEFLRTHGRVDDAIRILTETRSNHPAHSGVLFASAATHFDRAEWARAEMFASQCLANSPSHYRARNLVGLSRLYQGYDASALQALEDLPRDVRLRVPFIRGYLGRGQCHS